MAKPWLSTVEKLTEFFSADQLEASARRTKFVQRASKITGKLFAALVTFAGGVQRKLRWRNWPPKRRSSMFRWTLRPKRCSNG